ncbi:MAG: hypothetical protein U9R15_20005 [Chloroflexota bacterium]|nr:hypothetical protein [Chloroflexota bacterium]
MNMRSKIESRLKVALRLALVITPLAIGLAWGTPGDDSAYAAFRRARDLARGEQALSGAPLYVLALWLPARLGIPLPHVGLVLSALGWGAAAAAIYAVGLAMGRPLAAVVSAALVAFNPAIVSTLGTEASWAVALTWLAVSATVSKRWRVQTGALALLLFTRLDCITLSLAALLVIAQGVRGRRFPLWTSLILAAAGLCWGLTANSIPVSGVAAEAMATTLGLFMVGLGIGWIVEWIKTRSILRLDHLAITVSAALVLGSPLGMIQASSLWQRYQFRPVARWELERQAGDWLRARAEPAATILTSERVGYLADRVAIPWDGSESGQAELTLLLQALTQSPPDYCVSFDSIGWDHLMRTSWFQDSYEPLQMFDLPYDGASPLTIWRYRFRAFDMEERRPLNARLPGGVDFVGYKYWPARIQPGGAVYVTLFLRAAQPVTDSFRAVVRIISPGDGVGWAQRETHISHRSTLTEWWQTENVIIERFVLTTTDDIPTGAYYLEVSAAEPDSENFLPIYRDEDTSPLDKIRLGYVAVPWQGKMDRTRPVRANFGDQVSLMGFEAADSLSPGDEFDVTLYWEALRLPEDDYVVFVHLMDDEGRVVASHDGPPMEGRYPTSAWLPGEIVPDVRQLTLDPDAPAGTYWLRVGMYGWPSLERLPVWDEQGVEQTERVVVLQPVEVVRSRP